MWLGRTASCDGIRFCYGPVPVSEKITVGSWSLELSASWLRSSLQLLSQCCFCVDSILVHIMHSIYWLTILLIIIVALLFRFLFKVIHEIFWPSDIQIARDIKRSDSFEVKAR